MIEGVILGGIGWVGGGEITGRVTAVSSRVVVLGSGRKCDVGRGEVEFIYG